MPADVMMVVVAIVAAFGLFAATLAWADIFTNRAPKAGPAE